MGNPFKTKAVNVDSTLSKKRDMAANDLHSYPPELSVEQSRFLLSEVKDWSILHGLAVRPSQAFVPNDIDPSRSLAVTAPVSLFPSLFPRSCFEEARAIEEAYNALYAAIAADGHWLAAVVEEYAEPYACTLDLIWGNAQNLAIACVDFL